MSKCLSEIDLERYHAGELHAAESAALESHIQGCAVCAGKQSAFLAAHEAMVRKLHGLGGTARELIQSKPRSRLPDAVDMVRRNPTGLQIEGYEILREIHRGGQGVVYQAIQRTTKRNVAIKLSLEGAAMSISAKKRFAREIDLVAQLRHAGIITIFDSGETVDGRQYFVMDYVEGVPLNQYIREKQSPLENALKLFDQVCRAVHYAHQRGIIHRDLKPSNVLVDAEGGPRVLDFGLAKSIDVDVQTQVSMTGQVFGTLPYMAPEQAAGRHEATDARTDVYALGVMLYEVLTGQYPYPVAGALTDVLKAIMDIPPSSVTAAWRWDTGIQHRLTRRRLRRSQCPIDEEVETIVLKCLAKEPERRYQSAEAVAEDISRYLNGQPILAKRDSSWYVLRKSIPRYKATIAAAVAILVTGGAVAGLRMQRSRMDARIAEEKHRQRESVVEQCQDAVMLLDSKRMGELLDRAQDLDLDPAMYHCYRGYAHFLRLEDDAALIEADASLKAAPNLAEAHYLRAGIQAYRGDMLAAMKELAEGQKYIRGTSMELAIQLLLKSLFGQYDSAMKDCDALVARQHGSAAVLFVRGFARWLRLVSDPPVELEERRKVAELALADLNASADLYPNVAFMFDVRADVHVRLAHYYLAKSDMARAEEHFSARDADAQQMENLGAKANSLIIRSYNEMLHGRYDAARRFAEEAYIDARKPAAVKAINRRDALQAAVNNQLVCGFALGEDSATYALARRLRSEINDPALAFDFAVVEGLLGDRNRLRPAIQSAATLPEPLNLDPTAFWLGLAAQGESELASAFAHRLTIGLIDRWQFTGQIVAYLQGQSSRDDLVRAAGKNANLLILARLAGALVGTKRDDKIKRLETALAVGQPGVYFDWAAALMHRARNDPGFLAKPFVRVPKAATTRPTEE